MSQREFRISKWPYIIAFAVLQLPFWYFASWIPATQGLLYQVCIGIITGGFLFMIFVSGLFIFQTQSAIVISRKGITINLPFSRFGFVAWSEIQHIKSKDGLLGQKLVIVLNEPSKFFRGINLMKKIQILINKIEFKGAIAFSCNAIARHRCEDILKICGEFSSVADTSIGFSEQPGES
ncbi:MAG: hypothetical protein KF824_06980 [Fimbriimonadaceae bacterium]|nr:MAG: hypothetical protein KF824_06980 [Fimbriimonadaceae bacterium]